MQYIKSILLAGFAIYIFFLMISNIDFAGMDFSEIKLVISICIGIAISVVSVKAGINFMYSALSGFVVGIFIFVVIQTITQALS